MSKKRLTTKEFIERAKIVHGDKYDYSKVKYINNRTKVCIICPTHGEFWQTPNNHLNGKGCKKCGIIKRKNKRAKDVESFIKTAKKVHGDKYNYSKVNYVNSQTKVCIVCPQHGEFWQTPNSHLYGRGCPKCGHRSYKYTTEEFIQKAKNVHGDKYDYSKVEYISTHTKVCIVCPQHGEFWQTPASHLKGQGCPKCSNEINALKRKMNSKKFIEKARKIHGDKYDYSKVEYIDSRTKVCIVCPQHGEFWQMPSKHLFNQGCSICNNSIIEEKTKLFLEQNNIDYKFQYRIWWLKNSNDRYLSIDFYLPQYNVAIECQGMQHFKVIEHFGGKKMFNKRIENDILKKSLCEEHNINVLYITDKSVKTKINLYNKDNTISVNDLNVEKIKSAN